MKSVAACPKLARLKLAKPKTNPVAAAYGFAGFVGSTVACISYLTWAFVPDPFLELLPGDLSDILPSKYWALALPAWITVAVIYSVFMYMCMNLMATAPSASFTTVVEICAGSDDETFDTSFARMIPDIGDIEPRDIPNRAH